MGPLSQSLGSCDLAFRQKALSDPNFADPFLHNWQKFGSPLCHSYELARFICGCWLTFLFSEDSIYGFI